MKNPLKRRKETALESRWPGIARPLVTMTAVALVTIVAAMAPIKLDPLTHLPGWAVAVADSDGDGDGRGDDDGTDHNHYGGHDDDIS